MINKKENTDYKKVEYKLPKDTRLYLPERNEIDNYYLLFHKFPPFNQKDNKFSIKGFDSKEYATKLNSIISKELNPRRLQLLKELQQSGYTVASRKLEIDGKLSIGLGQPSVYEVSLNLDFIYGIPYIPASSIKGLLLDYYKNELNDNDNTNTLFGSEAYRGKLIFLDAYPINDIKIDLDIMNPHYDDYYRSKGGTEPPNDFLNPIPVIFPVVTKAVFEFTVIVKDDNNINLEDVLDNLTNALKLYGIGAKTALGYGMFKSSKYSIDNLIRKFNRWYWYRIYLLYF